MAETMEETIMKKIYYDEIGRRFCRKHRREVCYECCYDFSKLNEIREVDAGLRAPKSEFDQAAENWCEMKKMQHFLRINPEWDCQASPELARMIVDLGEIMEEMRNRGDGEKIDQALEKAEHKLEAQNAELRGLRQAWANENPGDGAMEFGGPDTQRLYDKFIKPPTTKADRADPYTCSYCHKISTIKLHMCSRCKKVGYCNRDCQKAAWKLTRLFVFPR